MIKVFGRLLCVPENEKMLGFVRDNLVETRIFKISDPALLSFSFKLELENGSVKNIMDLSRKMEGETLYLTWNIPAACLQIPGPLYAQLRAFNDSDMVWHSDIAEFTVSKSINAEGSLPPVIPSEFLEMEKRMTQTVENAEAFADRAERAATDATTYEANYAVSLQKTEENAARTGEHLKEVQSILEIVANMHSDISESTQDVQSARAYIENHIFQATNAVEKAEASAREISASLGDLHAVLDVILSLEAFYIGGDAA